MNAKVVISVEETTMADISAFVQMIREWELKTPEATIVGVLFETDPAITSEEAKQIFDGVFPEFEHQAKVLRLGSRGLLVQGNLMGTCDELTLSIAQGSDDEIKAMQDAEIISLVKMNKG